MQIAVVFGGCSVEHEISIITGIQVIASINRSKYKCIPVYLTKDNRFTIGKDFDKIETFKNKKKLQEVLFTKAGIKTKFKTIPIDGAMLCVHGKGVEGGELSGFFEILGIPYTSCGVLAASIAQDKIIMKQILSYEQIPVVPFIGISYYDWINNREEILNKCNQLNYPLIIKAANLGSSIGIERIKKPEELEHAIINVFKFDNRVIVEEIVNNFREFNCGIINKETLSVVEEVITVNEILTFNDKYEESLSQRIIPAKIDQDLENKIYQTTKKLSQIIDNHGVSRIDYLYDREKDLLFVNEINTIPGSLSYYLFEDKGIYFDELIEKLIDQALKRKYHQSQMINTFKSNVLNFKGIKK